MQNGIFYCSFTRENYVEGEKEVSDLNKDWFMMFAEGPAVNGKLEMIFRQIHFFLFQAVE